MYKKIENSPRMTMHEASTHYPNGYILMQMEKSNMVNPAGIILYIGDDGDELFSLQVRQPVPRGIVFEGDTLQLRYSLGGIVVG